jgi:uncharacterized protein (DUF2342 family)
MIALERALRARRREQGDVQATIERILGDSPAPDKPER